MGKARCFRIGLLESLATFGNPYLQYLSAEGMEAISHINPQAISKSWSKYSNGWFVALTWALSKTSIGCG